MSVARGIRNACLPALILWALIIAGVLALVGCEQETGGNIMLPPERYQGNGMAIVITADRHEIERICADKLNHYAAACADIGGPGRVWIENPCHVADQHWYPALLCHEIGHVRSWPADHRN